MAELRRVYIFGGKCLSLVLFGLLFAANDDPTTMFTIYHAAASKVDALLRRQCPAIAVHFHPTDRSYTFGPIRTGAQGRRTAALGLARIYPCI
jgi:hypothetical protein